MTLFFLPEYLFSDITTEAQLKEVYPTMDTSKISVRELLKNKIGFMVGQVFQPNITIDFVNKNAEAVYDGHVYYNGKKQTSEICALGGQIIDATCEELPYCGVEIYP